MDQPNINPSEQNTNSEPIVSPNLTNSSNKSNSFSKILIVFLLFFVFIGAGIFLGKTYFSPQTPITAIPTLAPKVIPPADPIVDWKTYKNKIYGFEFKYPQTFELIDKLPTEYKQIVVADENLLLTNKGKEINLNLSVNPAGFGPFFSNKIFEVDYSDDKGIYTVKETEQDVSQYRNDDKTEIMIPQTTVLKNHNIFIRFSYKKSNSNGEDLFKSILSTFKFTDQTQTTGTENWKTYADNKFPFLFKYPTDTKVELLNGYSEVNNILIEVSPNNKNQFLIQVENNPAGGQYIIEVNSPNKREIATKQWVISNIPERTVNFGYPLQGNGPFLVYQFVNQNVSYAIILNGSATDSIQDQILSTFKIIE